jgi:N-acetyl-anhydromuramyl-L-alanine amidase AmpD
MVTWRRTSAGALLLITVAALAVGAASIMLAADPSPMVRPRDAAPKPPRVLQTESASERLARLWPQITAGTTRMREPSTEPLIQRHILRQTRHDGHVGLYTDRPAGFRPVAVVLHATGSGQPGSEFPDTGALGAFFQRQGVAASHYGIGRDGTIAQYVDERHAAYHVSRPGWNGISIGIELLNDNTGSQPFPPAQLRSARALVATLGKRYGIPVEAVVPHHAIQPEDRSDPASNFPWESFVDSLAAPRGSSSSNRERLEDGRGRLAMGADRADADQ